MKKQINEKKRKYSLLLLIILLIFSITSSVIFVFPLPGNYSLDYLPLIPNQIQEFFVLFWAFILAPLLFSISLALILKSVIKNKYLGIGGIFGSVLGLLLVVSVWGFPDSFPRITSITGKFLIFITGCTQECWTLVFILPIFIPLLGLFGGFIGWLVGRFFKNEK